MSNHKIDEEERKKRKMMKCERCDKYLIHDETNTEVVYCHRCGGNFCFECWGIQRKEEEDKELEAQMESDAQAMEDMYRQGKELGIYKDESIPVKEGALPPCQRDPPEHFFQGFAHGGAEICLRCGYARFKPQWENPK